MKIQGAFHSNDDFYSSLNHICTPEPAFYEFDVLVGVCRDESLEGWERMNCYRLGEAEERGNHKKVGCWD